MFEPGHVGVGGNDWSVFTTEDETEEISELTVSEAEEFPESPAIEDGA
ncbi:hypothetical protein [Streptomyces sp. NPDC096311]